MIQIEASCLHALQWEVRQGRLLIASHFRPDLMSVLREVVLRQLGDLDPLETTISRFRWNEVLDVFLVNFLLFVVSAVHRVEHHTWSRRVHLRLNFFSSDRREGVGSIGGNSGACATCWLPPLA